MTLDQRLEELRSMWPDLQWTDARLLDCDHDVVILDEALVFRFECEDPDDEPLEAEIRFLKRFRSRIGVPVPNYTYVDSQYRAAGYSLILGEPLTLARWRNLTQEQQHDVAVVVGKVLDVIHAVPVEDAAALGILPMPTLQEKMGWYLYLYQKLVRNGNLTETEMDYCEGVIESIVTSRPAEKIPTRVIHGDIEPAHILHDGRTIAGIIDFGDVALGDPAVDLSSLWVLGEGFIDDVLANYSQASQALKQRSYLWWFAGAIQILQWGDCFKDVDHWERGYRMFPSDVADPKREKGYWNSEC